MVISPTTRATSQLLTEWLMAAILENTDQHIRCHYHRKIDLQQCFLAGDYFILSHLAVFGMILVLRLEICYRHLVDKGWEGLQYESVYRADSQSKSDKVVNRRFTWSVSRKVGPRGF